MNHILIWIVSFAVTSTLFAVAGVVTKIMEGGFDRSLTDGGVDSVNLHTPAFSFKQVIQAGVLSATILTLFFYFAA